MKSTKPNNNHPWDQATTLLLKRNNCFEPELVEIDRGVNFFVMALEELGALPRFSCEGHPAGFYVAFEANYDLAMEIKGCAYFTVEIEGPNYWSIRKTKAERQPGHIYSEADKVRILRWAAESWLKRFDKRLAKLKKTLAMSQV